MRASGLIERLSFSVIQLEKDIRDVRAFLEGAEGLLEKDLSNIRELSNIFQCDTRLSFLLNRAFSLLGSVKPTRRFPSFPYFFGPCSIWLLEFFSYALLLFALAGWLVFAM